MRCIVLLAQGSAQPSSFKNKKLRAMFALSLAWVAVASGYSTSPIVLDFAETRYGEGSSLLMCLHGTLQCRALCCSVPFDRNWGGHKFCGHFGSHFKAEVWTNCWGEGNEGAGGNVRSQCCECVADEPPTILPKPVRAEGAESWLPSHKGQEGYFELPASHEHCDSRDDGKCSGFNLTCPTGSLSVPFNQCLQGSLGRWEDGFQLACGMDGAEVYTYAYEGWGCSGSFGGYQPPSAFCRICESTVPWAKRACRFFLSLVRL